MKTKFPNLTSQTTQCLVGTLVSLLFITSAMAQSLVAGRIESFNGLTSAYTLEQNGEIKDVRIYAPIYL